jgi:hypothetical protein
MVFAEPSGFSWDIFRWKIGKTGFHAFNYINVLYSSSTFVIISAGIILNTRIQGFQPACRQAGIQGVKYSKNVKCPPLQTSARREK